MITRARHGMDADLAPHQHNQRCTDGQALVANPNARIRPDPSPQPGMPSTRTRVALARLGKPEPQAPWISVLPPRASGVGLALHKNPRYWGLVKMALIFIFRKNTGMA